MDIEESLKTSKEVAMEKAEAIEDQEKRQPLRTAKEIAMERAERMMAEVEKKKEEIKKMEELAKEYNLDVKDAIEAKKAEIAKMEALSDRHRMTSEAEGGATTEQFESQETKLESVAAADNYREVTKEEMEASERLIREENNEKEVETNQIIADSSIKQERTQDTFQNYHDEKETSEIKSDIDIKEKLEKKPQTFAEQNQVESEEVAREIPETVKAESVAEEVETEAGKPASAAERVKVQMEALEDFRRNLKKSDEAKKIDELAAKAWELRAREKAAKEGTRQETSINERPANVVDIASARKEKPSTASEREKILMDAVADFRNEIKSKKKLLKMFDKILDLAGLGKERVAEAGRIDRIMRGDKRSDEAVKVDTAAGKAFEMGRKEEIDDLKSSLEKARNVNDLIQALDKVKTIKGNEGLEYSATMQKNHIKNLFMTGNPEFLNFITQAEGLRENVKRIFDAAKNESEQEIKPAV